MNVGRPKRLLRTPNIFIIPQIRAGVLVKVFAYFLAILRIDRGTEIGYTKDTERQENQKPMKQMGEKED